MFGFFLYFFILLSQTKGLTFISQCPVYGSPREVRVYGDYAYLATADYGFNILDISDPVNPFILGSCMLGGDGYCVRITDTIAYVGTADEYTGLYSINISSPNSPYVIDSVFVPGNVYSVAIKNNYAFLAADDYGLYVIDISNPANMMPYSQTSTTGDALAIDISGNYAYLASGTFEIFNISNPQNPQNVSIYYPPYPDYGTNVVVNDTIAYLNFDDFYGDFENYDINFSVSENRFSDAGAFRVFDVKVPQSPYILDAGFTSTDAFGIDYNSSYVVTCDLYQGVYLIDVSDPTNITVEDHYATSGRCDEVSMDEEYAYVANTTRGLIVLKYTEIIDTAPPVIDSTTVIGDTSYLGPYQVRTYITDDAGLYCAWLVWKRGEDPLFDSLPLINVGGNWFCESIPACGFYGDSVKYYIMAMDWEWQSTRDPVGAPSNCYFFRTLLDTISPIFDSTTIWNDTTYPGPYPVRTKIMDNQSIDSAILFYKRIEDPSFRTTIMNYDSLDWYQGMIPSVYLTEDSVLYYLQAWDLNGNTSFEPPTAPGTPFCFRVNFDNTGPIIDSVTIWHDTSFAGPYPVQAKITDSNGVDTAVIYYKRIEDVQFFPMAMVYQNNNWFSGDIPMAYVPEDTVKYYIWTRDTLGNISTDPEGAPSNFYSFIGRASVGVEEFPWVDENRFSVNWTALNSGQAIVEMFAPEEILTSIFIYDLSGRVVESHQNILLRPGVHQLTFSPETSGMFIIKIITPEHTFKKKFTVL